MATTGSDEEEPPYMRSKATGQGFLSKEEMASTGSGEEKPNYQASEVGSVRSTNAATIGPGSTIGNYMISTKLGEGSFGVVFKAENIQNGDIVAIKECTDDRSAKREIESLKKLRHPNVISYKDEVTFGGITYIVLEYMECNLDELAKKETLTDTDIKEYMKQLLSGLAYCHAEQVLHRDVKGANLLVKEGNLKLADFGSSVSMNEKNKAVETVGDYFRDPRLMKLLDGRSNEVTTLAYRPPDILLGSTQYGTEADMWSVGCIFARLLKIGSRLLVGSNEDDQLRKIYQLCGPPEEESWPGVSKLPLFEGAGENPPKRCLREEYADCDHRALDLLDQMLVLDPTKRISATKALLHPYFSLSSDDPNSSHDHDLKDA